MPDSSNNIAECLMIIASSSACAGERDLVREVLRGLGIGLTVVEWCSADDFKQQVTGKKYNFIYLGAHADSYGFGENSDSGLHPWEVLALAICESDCIQPGGTLFMGCCRGGMKTVAIKIMQQCTKIDQICGPFWTLKGNDITKAFHIFVETLVREKKDPVTAADRASQASNCKFLCYERLDLAGELETLDRLQSMEGSIDSVRAGQAALTAEVKKLSSAIEKLCASFPNAGTKEEGTKGKPNCGGSFYS
jgi:hypothetical protein